MVAIDGPAGAGKSTVARRLAARLGIPHLDTGAMYRAVTWAVLNDGVDPADPEAAARAARDADIDVVDEHTVRVGGVDVTTVIRGPDVTAAVSTVAAHPAVRAELVARQKAWIDQRGRGVVEGRDIGTVVLPDATLKAYLTATARTRARRRQSEQPGLDLAHVEAEIERRDALDAGREHSPLRPADDAEVVWTDELDADEVVDHLERMVRATRWQP